MVRQIMFLGVFHPSKGVVILVVLPFLKIHSQHVFTFLASTKLQRDGLDRPLS